MIRRPPGYPADVCGASAPEKEGASTQEARRRQAAALYLRAAAMTDNAVEREALRRRAAQLLSTERDDRVRRQAC
jgi:hypothetical protein